MKLMTWPVPALFAWGSSWLIFKGLQMVGLSEAVAFIVATCVGGFLSALAHTTMRKALIQCVSATICLPTDLSSLSLVFGIASKLLLS